jgi:glycosyltransferase involved in cell wall biosynthesis
MKKVRLLHLINSFHDASINRLVLQLVQSLDNRIYDRHVGCLFGNGKLIHEFSKANINVTNFEMRGYLDLGVVNRIKRYVLANEITVIHTHILRADLIGWFASQISEIHFLFATKHNLGYAPGQDGRILKNPLYYLCLYLPDVVVLVSEWMRQQLMMLPGLNNGRLTTIHNAIDVDYFHAPELRGAARLEMGLMENEFAIGYLGRLVPGKGLRTLIEAMRLIVKKYPNGYLIIIGEGSLSDELVKQAQSTGIISNVIFTGFRADVPRILAAIDYFVLPSQSEGLPLSLLEAMAAGKPSVATPIGGVNELIIDYQTGIFVEPNDPYAIAQAIFTLLNDCNLSEKLIRQAREHVSNHFKLDRMVQDYENLYQYWLG